MPPFYISPQTKKIISWTFKIRGTLVFFVPERDREREREREREERMSTRARAREREKEREQKCGRLYF
jgi:hypothetical protein